MLLSQQYKLTPTAGYSKLQRIKSSTPGRRRRRRALGPGPAAFAPLRAPEPGRPPWEDRHRPLSQETPMDLDDLTPAGAAGSLGSAAATPLRLTTAAFVHTPGQVVHPDAIWSRGAARSPGDRGAQTPGRSTAGALNPSGRARPSTWGRMSTGPSARRCGRAASGPTALDRAAPPGSRSRPRLSRRR